MKDCNKKAWLCYHVGQCEMGSEGHSSMMYPMVCYGDTDEEILDDYRSNLKSVFGKDIIGEVTYGKDGRVYSYYPIHKVFLPRDVYGDVKDYVIGLIYREHYKKDKGYKATISASYIGESLKKSSDVIRGRRLTDRENEDLVYAESDKIYIFDKECNKNEDNQR